MQNNDFFFLRRKVLEKYFSRMNIRQREAIFTVEGPVLVLAGAGSGKTTVLVNRIANIIKFGNAYNSDTSDEPYSDGDLSLMRDYIEGKSELSPFLSGILSSDAAKPWQILAITFTNKAAGEIKERLNQMLDTDSDNIWSGTFHSVCVRILRRFADRLGYTSHFTIYDTDDSARMMKDCLRELGIDDKYLPHKSVLREISMSKDALISPAEYRFNAGFDIRCKKIADCFDLYQKKLKQSDAMDFDDIIVNTVKLFEENADVLELYQNQFRYIMVDEYQDTNHAQYRLVSLLAEKRKNIFVVGDDDQSIYKFRGATIENILSFEDEYKDCKTIRLEENYRSTQRILDAANSVIKNNKQRKGKNLWTSKGDGEKVHVIRSNDQNTEADDICDTIADLISKYGYDYSDFAVLYRMNAQSVYIEKALVLNGIPYKIFGGLRFYDRAEIKDMLSYLAVVNNKDDEIRLKRIINVPKRGIGAATVQNAAEIASSLGISMFEVLERADEFAPLQRSFSKIKAFTDLINSLAVEKDEIPLNELFEKILSRTDYRSYLEADEVKGKEKLENIDELLNNIVLFMERSGEEAGLDYFLEEIALMTDLDNYNASSSSVVLMTLHSAKGLEFPVVFIPGMENGIFPGNANIGDEAAMEEERRLAYVGITRAKERLYLTYADNRMLYGRSGRNMPSQFLREIPEEYIEKSGLGVSSYSQSSYGYSYQTKSTGSFYHEKPKKREINRGFTEQVKTNVSSAPVTCDLKVGDTVRHRSFGQGVVLNVSPIAGDTMLVVAFDKVGTKKLLYNYLKSKLED